MVGAIRANKLQEWSYPMESRYRYIEYRSSNSKCNRNFLEGMHFPLFEIFDHTHQGNGFYYLYKLDGKKLTKIAETRAVDRCFDGNLTIGHRYECSIVYKNDQLIPIYKDLNNDGYADVILKGTIQIFAEDDKTLLRQYPAQKVLLYNHSKGRFIEDLTQRKGFNRDDD